MKNILVLILIFFTIGQSFCTTGVIKDADTLSAATVLSRSEKQYVALKTYLDSGKVVTEIISNGHSNKTAKIFKTAYSNTEGFNFEYYQTGNSNSLYVINRSKNVVNTWWGINNRFKTGETLLTALSAAAGVSERTSLTVPQLLFSKEFGKQKNIYHSFTQVLARTEAVNGLICYKITGTDRRKGKLSIWIAKKDFMIRKMEIVNFISTSDRTIMKNRTDSVMTLMFRRDSVSLAVQTDKENNPKLKAALLHKMDSIKQAQSRFKKLLTTALANTASGSISVKATYMYHPYTLKNINRNLFTFRPNREVAL